MGACMEEKAKLSDDGRFERVDNPYWSFYIDTEFESELRRGGCGKWMVFFTDFAFAESICRKAVLEEAVAKCKHTSAGVLEREGRGVICFYLNSDDVAAHRRVLAFMIGNGLVRKTKSGKLSNIPFKLDSQTMAGEYGSAFEAQIKLEDFVDLETGEFLQ